MRFDKIIPIIIIMVMMGCNSESDEVMDPIPSPDFELPVPKNFPAPTLDEENRPTTAGIALGKMLFFDTNLSGNGKVACVTCHLPEMAFADGEALTTAGVSGKPLLRHSPALFNLAWANNYFWDGGAKNLESQVFGPLTNENEMDADIAQIVDYLRSEDTYKSLFLEAFEDSVVTYQNVARAIAQFELTLISGNAKYDQYVRDEGVELSAEELDGLKLVHQHCTPCHKTDLFTDYSFHNNGLDSVFSREAELEGLGRGRITFNDQDNGKFKTPSLRNLSYTAPYMHDGRLGTLEEVINHYSEGIVVSPTLDISIPADGMQFTKEQKRSIIAFLHTLNDVDIKY